MVIIKIKRKKQHQRRRYRKLIVSAFIFKNVSFSWSETTSILENASFEISEGSFVVLRGASGSGKTTLLRLMILLEIQQKGAILYQGKKLNDYSPMFLRRAVGFLPQAPVVAEVSIGETLLQPFSFAANKHLPKPKKSALVEYIAELFDEPLELDTDASSLSLGQKQRLCFIRTLLISPQTLLLDEPTASLDASNKDKMIAMIKRQHANGKTVIVVTHDPLLFHFEETHQALLKNRQITIQ